MSKKIKIFHHDSLEEWHIKIKKIRNNEYKLKMLVIEKILSDPDISGEKIQEIFFISKATLYSWIKQYNDNGLDGLMGKYSKKRGSGKGRTKVDREIFLRLKNEMAKNPKKWTLKEQQNYIYQLCGVLVTKQAISYRMKNL